MGFGNRRKGAFISGEKGNKDQRFGGNMETKTILVTVGKNSFRVQGNNAIYFRGTREQVPNPDIGISVDEQQQSHVVFPVNICGQGEMASKPNKCSWLASN